MSFHDGKFIGDLFPVAEYIAEREIRGSPQYAMSRHALLLFAQNPARWLAGFSVGESESKSFGSLVDCLALTPDKFASQFAVKPATYRDTKTGEDKKWNGNSTVCKEWLAANEGVECLTVDELAEGKKAASALMADEAIATVIESSAKQCRYDAVWHDDETGIEVPVKTLVDLVPLGQVFLADLKTTNSAAPKPWIKSVANYGYDVQATLFLDVFNSGNFTKRNEFRHILVENYPPYATGKRILSEEFLSRGRAIYRAALRIYARCIHTGKFPNYDEMETTSLQINGWTVTEPDLWMMTNAPAAQEADWLKGA